MEVFIEPLKVFAVLTMWREPEPPPRIPPKLSGERWPPCSQSELYQQPPVGTHTHTHTQTHSSASSDEK